MPRPRRCPHTLTNRAAHPFSSAEEAWFWFARCIQARRDGARFVADAGALARPCDPDDVGRAVIRLRRAGSLARDHVAVLTRFGHGFAPPDSRLADQRAAARLWDEALERLDGALRERGIVA